jgi:hypothetical protein
MDPTVVAMILLSCNAQMRHCHTADTSPALYASMAACTTALPSRLEGTGMIGKCRPANGAVPNDRVAVVRVVRGSDATALSTDYIVPRMDSTKDSSE